MSVEECRPTSCESVQMWSLGHRMPAKMPNPIILVIDRYKQYVRLRSVLGRRFNGPHHLVVQRKYRCRNNTKAYT
jgi:hypothetical protein